MKWPWRRREHKNGDAARQATRDAEDAYTKAQQQTRHVDRTTGRAKELVRNADWFTRDMERALRLRRGPL